MLINERIEVLKSESVQAGDEKTVRRCLAVDGLALYDSDTNGLVQPEELFPDENCPIEKYVDAIFDSLHCKWVEGHVRIHNRRVFAQ